MAVTKNNVLIIDKESYDELVKELEYRKDTLRQEIADEIATARQLGDLSENYAYTAAMEKKEMNEIRISELDDTLKRVQIAAKSTNKNVVVIGSKVELEYVDTKKILQIHLVGPEETQSAAPNEGKISVDSPVGKAIHNAKVGEVVEVILPARTNKIKIVKILD